MGRLDSDSNRTASRILSVSSSHSFFHATVDSTLSNTVMDKQPKCVVCCDESQTWAVGACEHATCLLCTVRLRVLCEQKECPVCREKVDKVTE